MQSAESTLVVIPSFMTFCRDLIDVEIRDLVLQILYLFDVTTNKRKFLKSKVLGNFLVVLVN